MWKPKIIEIYVGKERAKKNKYVVIIEINVGKEKTKKSKYVVVIEINVVKQKTMCYSHRRSARLFSSLLSQRFMFQHRKQEIFSNKRCHFQKYC